MPDRVFEALFEATGSLDWSSADQVKRRGRQRARRRRVAVVAASLVLAFGVSGGMVSVLRASGGPPGQPSLTTPSAPTPTVAPTPAPSTSASGNPMVTVDPLRAPIPDTAMLTARDMVDPVTASDVKPAGDGILTTALAYCAAEPFVKQPTTERARTFAAGEDMWAAQWAGRRPGNGSVQHMSQLITKVHVCNAQDPTRQYTVVEQSFVGEASVLITFSYQGRHELYVLFVAGGVEVELFFKNSVEKSYAKRLAQLLANRLG